MLGYLRTLRRDTVFSGPYLGLSNARVYGTIVVCLSVRRRL